MLNNRLAMNQLKLFGGIYAHPRPKSGAGNKNMIRKVGRRIHMGDLLQPYNTKSLIL
jgi:hypothetical protein